MESISILNDSVNIFSDPYTRNIKLSNIKKGDEYGIVEIEKIDDIFWIKLILTDGSEGYTNDMNNVAILLPATLSRQKEVVVYCEPNSGSKQVTVVKKKEILYLLHKTYDTLDQSKIWKKVKLENGEFGYINSDTNLIPVNKSKKKRERKCKIASLIIVSLLYLIKISNTVSGNRTGLELYLVLIVSFWAFNSLFMFTSGFFKSETEKYYYPNLLNAFANQII